MANLDSEQEQHRLNALYASMSDGELSGLATDPASLTDVARTALAAEIKRRGSAFDDSPLKSDVPEFQRLVTIRQFTGLPEALLAKGSIESSGIDCFLADDNYIRMDWFISNFIGGIKLKVKPEDVADANAVLDQPIPESIDVEGVGIVEQPRCPVCQSLDVTFQELDQPISYAMASIGLPIPVLQKAWLCHTCKHKWKADEEAA